MTSKTWSAQAPDLKEHADDIKWKAGTTHVPTSSQAPKSTIVGNTNRACYFYEELPKIGRNPKDFDKNVTVKFGARIYKADDSTTFDSVPESSATIKKDAMPSYVAAATVTTAAPGGAADFAMAVASFVMAFALFF